MDGQSASRRSVWADLDALVLEEVDALRAGPDRPAGPPAFASEAEFVACVSAYLRGHADAEALVERLRAELGPAPPPEAEEATAATSEGPLSAAPEQDVTPPAAADEGEPET